MFSFGFVCLWEIPSFHSDVRLKDCSLCIRFMFFILIYCHMFYKSCIFFCRASETGAVVKSDRNRGWCNAHWRVDLNGNDNQFQCCFGTELHHNVSQCVIGVTVKNKNENFYYYRTLFNNLFFFNCFYNIFICDSHTHTIFFSASWYARSDTSGAFIHGSPVSYHICLSGP